MKICGYNKYSPFPEKSNNRSLCKEPCISPPCDHLLNVSSLLSYSCYSDHAVFIQNDFKAYALGSNKDFCISKTIPELTFSRERGIIILDSNKQRVRFLSAVCGYHYTLYLVSLREGKNNKLIYSHSKLGLLFLNINGHNPLKLFGGGSTSAAIDSEGSVIVVTRSVFNSPKKALEASSLPGGEKAVCAACCERSVLVLCASGRVFESVSDITKASKIEFAAVGELCGQKVVHISGSDSHFIAVCDNGRVFGRGSNEYGRLGIGKEQRSVDKFTEISSLRYKIVSASASNDHSLFLTSENKVLACGSNYYGQLLLSSPSKEDVYLPVETTITSGATFAIAGYSTSAVFVGIPPPPNTPNMGLHVTPKASPGLHSASAYLTCLSEKPKDSLSPEEVSSLVVELMKENARLKEENVALQRENESLKEKLVASEFELEEASAEIAQLRAKESSMEEEMKKFVENAKEVNGDLKKQLDSLKANENSLTDAAAGIRIFDVAEIESLEVIRRLGRGATSEVFEVARKETLALKQLEIELCRKINDEEEEEEEEIELDIDLLKRFLLEYQVVNVLQHPNIVKTFGFCFGDSTHGPSILLEFCPSNLKKKVKKLNNEERARVLSELASAMEKVHSAGIIHRDLKLENILLDKENHVKLSDFGLCTLIDSGNDTVSRTQSVGTLSYMAPELIQGRKDYDEKVDVYAFGVVVFLVLTKGEEPRISIADVAAGRQAAIPDTVSDLGRRLIRKCWSYDAEDRPSFEEINEFLHLKAVDLF
ncbi:hypothetical protein M9Y10_035709 [Tritrichomonas musculus]|uniref:Protein kinase domain-containing protein n=1 Tax=Tritrichomonas musculus TaxID=1915356 RepID=A0ABR2GWP8_9EUKA